MYRNRVQLMGLISSVVVVLIVAYILVNKQLNSGASLLMYRDQSSIWLINTDTREKWMVANESGSWERGLGWSPSGKKMLLMGQGGLWVADSYGRNSRLFLSEKTFSGAYIQESKWLTDDLVIIVFVSSENKYQSQIFKAETGASIITDAKLLGYDIIPSPTGTFWLQRRGYGWEVANLNGKIVNISEKTGVMGTDIGFSPNGLKIAFPSLVIANITDQGVEVVQEIKQSNWAGSNIRWSPDGKYIAYGGGSTNARNEGSVMHILDASTGEQHYEWKWQGKSRDFLWSPHSDMVLSDDGRIFFALNIFTGETKVILDDASVASFVDWRFIKN